MTKNDKNTKALSQPAGAVFYRCALQVNSHHYGATFRGQPTPGDAASHARAIVARIRAWQSKDLLAIQIPASPDELLDDLRPIVKNQSVDYRREHTAEHNFAVAVVNAKDIVKPEDLGLRAATCWKYGF